MKLNKLIILLGALWCQQFVEITTAPSPPFKPSQRLPGPLDEADQFAISLLAKEASREKRGYSGTSSSTDFFKHLKKSIGQGIKNKIHQLAKSSAGSSAYFSKSSSAHHHGPPEHGHHLPYPPPHPPHPHPPPHYYPVHDYEEKPFDLFDMKKSVLFTLLQAVKAIKGGVIAVKGQLLKGGGNLLTAKGKLIRGGGEILTSLGKNIALSAFHLVPASHEEDEGVIHESGAEDHPLSAGYGYSAPSAPGHEIAPSGYDHPTGGGAYYHNSVYDGKPSQQQQQHDGLIILRKIPKTLRHPGDSNGDHTNDEHHQQQHEEIHHAEHDHQHHQQNHHPQQYAAYAYHEQDQDQQDVQESQKTPAFRPLSDGIVPKMKNLVTSVFQSSVYPPTHVQPTKQYANVPNHSQYSAQYNIRQQHQNTNQNNAKVQTVQPQQANVGALFNYLDYIQNLQKNKTPSTSGAVKGQGITNDERKVKSPVFVTPTPLTHVQVNQPEPQETQNKQPATGEKTVTHEVLKQETALLEQQLQQLASLQSLQHQLQLINPYAGAEVAQVQQSQALNENPPIQSQQGQGLYQVHAQPQSIDAGQLNTQTYPAVLDLSTNSNLASMLTQFQVVPEVPDQGQSHYQIISQSQPQPQVETPQIIQYLEDPLVEAESSNIPTFLINVPEDDEIEEGRSMRPSRAKPKSKRHLRPIQIQSVPSQRPSTKVKKLSQLQQLQLMQQQLHRHAQLNQPEPTPKITKQNKRSPTIDVVRSIAFEIGSDGVIKST